jgi:alpha-1,6-mannosyltransferase
VRRPLQNQELVVITQADRGSRPDTAPPDDRTGRERTGAPVLLLAAAVLGTAATGYLAMAGPSLGSHLAAPDLWFYEPAPRLLAAGVVGDRAEVANFVALGVWAVGWLLAGLAARRGGSVRALLLVGVVWVVPLLLAPPLFSPDAYAYTAIGAAIQHGVDPYVSGPGAAGDIPAVRGVEPFWRNSPTPYSPPFLALLAGLSKLFSEDLLSVLVALRVLSVAAWASLAFSVGRLAERWGVDSRRAVWLGVVNPLVLVNAVSGNHNDVLMMALVVPGLLLASANHPLWGAALCGIGAGVKVTALAAVLVIGVDLARRQTGRRDRLRALVLAGGVGTGAFVLLSQIAGYGWGWLGTLLAPGRAIDPMAPANALAVVLHEADPPVGTVRLVVSAAGAVVCLLLLTRLPAWGLARVAGWVLFVLMAAGPVLWPWYALWPVVVLAAAGRPRERLLVAVLSVALLFATLPGGQPTLSELGRPLADQLVLGTLIAVLLGCAAQYLVASRRSRRWTSTPMPESATQPRVATT